MQDPRAVAQQAVRHDLEQVERPETTKHLAPQDDQPAVLEHAHLAPVLGLVRRCRLLPRMRLGLVHRPAPVLDHQVRKREVVAEARVDLDVVGAAQGIDRAVAAGDGAELRLGRTLLHLVAPVDALLVAAVGVQDAQLPTDVGDLGVREHAHEGAQRIGRPGAVRVGERDDLTVGLPHRAVLRRNLAPARIRDHLHARELEGDLLGAVGRGVGADDDLQLLGRVVEGEQVLDPSCDHRLLVVGRDDHGHRGLDVSLLDTARCEARKHRRAGRVGDMGPYQRGQR